MQIECKRDKCRSLSKAWNHRTASLEKLRIFVRLQEHKDGFYPEVLNEASKGSYSCESKNLFKVRSSTLCLKLSTVKRGKMVMLW